MALLRMGFFFTFTSRYLHLVQGRTIDFSIFICQGATVNSLLVIVFKETVSTLIFFSIDMSPVKRWHSLFPSDCLVYLPGWECGLWFWIPALPLSSCTSLSKSYVSLCMCFPICNVQERRAPTSQSCCKGK